MIDGLVSIIMPSWNTERFLGDAIRCVLAQTYGNWELLIVDDCSEDRTEEVVREFSDPRIRFYVMPEHGGAAEARNLGLREARGEWIAFLDSDDLWMPEKLEKQIAFMKENGYVLSYHDFGKMDEDGKPLGIRVSGPAVVDRKKMYRYDYIGQLTMMYSAAHFGLIQIRSVRKNNDYAIRLALYRKEGTVAYLLPEKLAMYRVRTVSLSHDAFRRKFRSHYDLFHVCDGKPAPVALFCACRNMWFGLLKKRDYEKKEA